MKKVILLVLVTAMFASCAPGMYSIHSPDTATHKFVPKPKKVANIRF